MTDPGTGFLVKEVAKAAQTLGRGIYDKAGSTSSSARMSEAIAELEAEEVADHKRRLSASLTSEGVARVHLEIRKRHDWEGEPEGEQPRVEDVAYAALDLIQQARRAGSNRKRDVLFHAFYMRFSPEFYKDGMGKMLWKIACDLEYPTMRALREMAELQAEALKEHRNRNKRGAALGGRVEYNSEVWPHVARLDAHGLIVANFHKDKSVSAFISSLGHAFVRFALDEYRERGDTPAAVTEE